MNNGRFLVSKVVAEVDLKSSIQRAVSLIGGLDKVIVPGDKVTIKPNLNTADPYPASSDPAFIKALGEVILDAGASKLEIIDSSTLRVLKSGSIGKPLLNIQKLVLAPCLKTHFLAGYTGSMKLFVGWIKHNQRIRMHARNLQPKIADLASYFKPDLIVMDARTCFVTGGPASGTCSSPGVILASGDMVTIDVEGARIIQCCNAKNKIDMDVWQIPQIKHAVELGIGAKRDSDIEVVE